MYISIAVKAITINIDYCGSGKMALVIRTASISDDNMINPQSVRSMTISPFIITRCKYHGLIKLVVTLQAIHKHFITAIAAATFYYQMMNGTCCLDESSVN